MYDFRHVIWQELCRFPMLLSDAVVMDVQADTDAQAAVGPQCEETFSVPPSVLALSSLRTKKR